MKQQLLVLLGSACLATPVFADECAHRAERNLDLDASSVSALDLRTGAGDLEVRGEPGLDRVVVRGVACASEAGWLEQIRLVHRTDGDRLQLATEIPDTEDSSWFGDDYRYLDLQVRVPARLALDATDSSGDMDLAGVASATITDSSGDLEIEAIAGDLRISDTSGDIEASDIGGELHVRSDSSGDIEAERVAGNVAIDSDSSGDITLRHVQGDALVGHDSSGDIRFADIDGSATVGNDSSGSIQASRIGRDFTVRSDTSGDIDHHDVTGEVHIPTR